MRCLRRAIRITSGVRTTASMSARKLSHGTRSIDGFQRIALRRQRRQPLLRIEKPELSGLPNHAIAIETRTTRAEQLFFEASLRF